MQPVLRPDLPSARALLPYLEAIDHEARASNDGPLVRRLEAKLGGVCVSSGTLGLELAAKAVFRRGVVRVPALTFPATATAVIRAGLTPLLCDVRLETWAAEADDRTLAVCPFGYPTDGPLIDAAGAYGIQRHGARVVSLHATKPLPAGEGGVVIGPDQLLDEIREARNFGFRQGVIVEAGTNAKLSEYHAAVALAALDRYDHVATRRQQVAERYHTNLGGEFELRPYMGSTVFPMLVSDPYRLMQALERAGYEARRWYCPSLDQHPAFASVKREALPITHHLAGHLICLPFHTFLTDSDIDRVSEVVCST